ncbi:MAG TPA: ABC transporter substrate-binding protein [Myxococcales bacterium]|nr:ABC transporter substrate-binding protein [Myxococcales bacterium]
MALTGDLSETPFTDLVQFYCQRRETVALIVETSRGEGTFWIADGELVDARLGKHRGLDAVRTAMKLSDGTFRVDKNAVCPARAIFEPWTKVLLEEAWREDEANRDVEDALAGLDKEAAVTLERKPTPPRPTPGSIRPPMARPPMHPPAPPAKNHRGALLLGVVAVLALGGPGVLLLKSHWMSDATSDGAARDPVKVASVVQPSSQPVPIAQPDLLFGMAAPLTGPSKELGRAMKTGVEVAFDAANDNGGVRGRRLRLIALDDGYEPSRTAGVMKELAEQRHVFGFIGNVGTPTAVVAVPYAVEHKMLFFGPFTGAPLLRKDPPDRYVFNYRASYAEETAATVRHLVDIKRIKPHDIAVFAQADAYGDAGFEGVARAMRRWGRDPSKIVRLSYQRNTADVTDAVNELSKHTNIRAVVCVATYKAAAKLIEKMREKGSDIIFTNVSFVGSNALAEELAALGPRFAQGAIVTQVVPLPQSSASAVLRYQDLLRKYAPGEKPDFVSLEGYLAGTLLVEGLKRASSLETERVIDALESIRNLDLGTGASLSFGMSEHQASHKVWGTVLDEKGVFQTFQLD